MTPSGEGRSQFALFKGERGTVAGPSVCTAPCLGVHTQGGEGVLGAFGVKHLCVIWGHVGDGGGDSGRCCTCFGAAAQWPLFPPVLFVPSRTVRINGTRCIRRMTAHDDKPRLSVVGCRHLVQRRVHQTVIGETLCSFVAIPLWLTRPKPTTAPRLGLFLQSESSFVELLAPVPAVAPDPLPCPVTGPARAYDSFHQKRKPENPEPRKQHRNPPQHRPTMFDSLE